MQKEHVESRNSGSKVFVECQQQQQPTTTTTIPSRLLLPSTKHPTPSLLTPPLVPSHRRLDKRSFSVGRELGVTPLWMCFMLVGINISSFFHLYPSIFYLCYQREFALPLSPSSRSLFYPSFLSIWYPVGCWQRGRDPERGESRP